MSGQRFDDLTRAVANGTNGTTRRAFLKRLLIGAGGAVVPLGAAARAEAQVKDSKCTPLGHKCAANVQCCSRYCDKNGRQCTCIPDEELICPRTTGQLQCVRTCHNPNNPCETSACDPVTGGCMVVPAPQGVVCREAAGPCDVAEVCTGTSTQCPPNGFLPAGTVCLEAQGPCAGPSLCSGNSAQCPENPLLPDTTICRPADGPCDVPEFCTGTSNQCPPNEFKPNGTPCDRDENLCTLDFCENGVCKGGPQKTCPASTDPCKVNVCDPATGNYVTQNAPNGTPCTDNNLCTTGETCQNGTCQGGTQKTCPAGQTCVPATGECQCTTGVTCGTLCCTGSQGFCCPPGTARVGQCRSNLNACQ